MAVRKAHKHWLIPGGPMQPWIDALRDVDERDDKTALVALLKSKTRMPTAARHHVANLLYRKLKPNPDARRTPSYTLSDKYAQLEAAAASVRQMRKKGVRPDQALERAAQVRGVNKDTLQNVIDGKHGSFRRAKKRRSANF